MNIREHTENIEKNVLSKYAAFAENSRGRLVSEGKCDIRTDFQRDRDRILHSKSFRRLKHKTQVFLSPEGDHYRTRLTHTLEVAQISRTIARALRLNEDLTEAIALGHDLGHTPFGHCGEEILNEIHETGFRHNEQSLRIVDYLEGRRNNKRGLNLTHEVRDGILNHTGGDKPFTLEGQIVKISDRIAYINHDIDDALRADILSKDIFKEDFFDTLGYNHSERINTMILDIVKNSMEKDEIKMSSDILNAMDELRSFMFKNVYYNPQAKKEERKAKQLVSSLYEYFSKNPDKMSSLRYEDFKRSGSLDPVRDFISGMTDRYAVNIYKEIFVPSFWI